MKERPILFSGPMVRAILDGRKSMTRRVIKPQPAMELDGEILPDGTGGYGWAPVLPPWSKWPYQIGDRLWVRETWYCDNPAAAQDAMSRMEGVYFKATEVEPQLFKWRPSIHMPRWASRITLEITSVRVERLQEITANDVIEEGINPIARMGGIPMCKNKKGQYCTAREAFIDLWDTINGKTRPWLSDPWVWVIEFKRQEGDHDSH